MLSILKINIAMAPLVYFRYVLVGVLISGFTGFASASSTNEVDQLDEADRQEFNASVARASACGKARDFQCASNALVRAKKYANGSRDNSILKAAAENIEFMSQMSTQDDAKQKYGKERIALDTRTAESQRAALADAERSNSLQRQRQAEKEREDRQSANDARASPIDDWRKRDDAFWRGVRQQDSARITEGYRKRDEQQAELGRQRADSNGRAADQRREAERERADRGQQRIAQESAPRQTRVTSDSDLGLNAGSSNQSSKTTEREASNPSSKDRDVVESNPYERYKESARSWGEQHPGNGWWASVGVGTSRAEACASVTVKQAQWIAKDEAIGIVTVSDRTGCICGSYRTFANVTYTAPQWKCAAYHKLRETGKKAGGMSK